MKNLCVIIPSYNEEKFIRKTLQRVDSYLSKKPYDYQIVVSINGSTDNTLSIVKEIKAKREKITYILTHKKGKGHAIKKAVSSYDFDYYLFLDCDLSTDIDQLDKFEPLIKERYDLAIGSRRKGKSVTQRSALRIFLSKSYCTYLKFFFPNKFNDLQCGFKIFTKEIATNVVPYIKDNNWFFDTELVFISYFNFYKVREISIVWKEKRETKFNIINVIFYFIIKVFLFKFRRITKRLNL
ncbi:MAG: glycosyltransferase [Candidatus Muiribacteriota bacterium]